MVTSLAQPGSVQIEGKEVFKNEDVVFRQIDESYMDWIGHQMASESLYLIEGSNGAVLIDAGTKLRIWIKLLLQLLKNLLSLSPLMFIPTTPVRLSTISLQYLLIRLIL